MTSTFVCKKNHLFAHGKTIKEANESLQSKIFSKMSVEERIAEFKKIFVNTNIKYPAAQYFNWHYKLTGSCDQGRKIFCHDHRINMDKDSFTVKEFIDLTLNKYGSEIIIKLKKSYNL